MKLEDVIKKSIQEYYSGNAFKEYGKARGSEVKYSMDYFDKIEEELLNSKPEKEDEMEGEEDDS